MAGDLRGFWKPENPKTAKAHVYPLSTAETLRKERARKLKEKRIRRRARKQAKKNHKPTKAEIVSMTLKSVDRVLLNNGEKPQPFPTGSHRSDDGFYNSAAWKTARYLALKNCNGACQCCGARAADGVRLHVDHIKPRSQAPALALIATNLQVLCQDCNVGKGAWDDTDWREHMRSITGLTP